MYETYFAHLLVGKRAPRRDLVDAVCATGKSRIPSHGPGIWLPWPVSSARRSTGDDGPGGGLTPALIIALLSAALYGTADFFGGLAARRAPALAATVVAQALGWSWSPSRCPSSRQSGHPPSALYGRSAPA